MRTPIVGMNFKCNKTTQFLNEHIPLISKINTDKVEVIVSPPTIYLQKVKELLQQNNGQHLQLCAQNCYMKSGAFTGEISIEMLKDLEINTVIIGHSERRHIFGESNELCAERAIACLKAGMQVIFCVGEQKEDRVSGKTMEVINAQLKPLLDAMNEDKSLYDKLVIANEPVWSIGTGLVCATKDAEETNKNIRKTIELASSKDIADKIRIQYGGSVNAKNCEELSKCENIDGFLVGGASLKPEIIDICNTISKVKSE